MNFIEIYILHISNLNIIISDSPCVLDTLYLLDSHIPVSCCYLDLEAGYL